MEGLLSCWAPAHPPRTSIGHGSGCCGGLMLLLVHVLLHMLLLLLLLGRRCRSCRCERLRLLLLRRRALRSSEHRVCRPCTRTRTRTHPVVHFPLWSLEPMPIPLLSAQLRRSLRPSRRTARRRTVPVLPRLLVVRPPLLVAVAVIPLLLLVVAPPAPAPSRVRRVARVLRTPGHPEQRHRKEGNRTRVSRWEDGHRLALG